MRVLLIEDEKKAAHYIQAGLMQHGCVVDVVDNGIDGVFYATEYVYDIVVLDVMLPRLDGWSVLKKIRERGRLPVILLTACDTVEDRVLGLNNGADDYLVKPFSFSELLARIHAVLRRGEALDKPLLQCHGLMIDLVKHKISLNGDVINLSPKEFSLLVFFMRREGHLLSRTLLAENVWDIHFDTDTNLVDVSVKRLRDKLKIDGENRFFHTVRGLGYVFEYR